MRWADLTQPALTEDAKDDLEKLRAAGSMFALLTRFIYAAMKEGGTAFWKMELYDQQDAWGKPVVQYTLPLMRAGAPTEYDDLCLVLTTRNSRWGGHYYSSWWNPHDGLTQKAIVLYLKGGGEAVLSQFRDMRDIFCHEFVHYLDDRRIPGGIGTAQTRYLHPEGSFGFYDEYYNNPVEFNAYFLQGAHTMIWQCDHTMRLRREIPKDFRQFLYSFTVENGFFHGEFRTLMNGKWRRQFIRRMKVLHDLLLQRYASGSRPPDVLP